MKVLGISDSSVCGGASVSVDGHVLASINEERLDRQKLSTGFPRRAIQRVMEVAGLDFEELDKVQVSDRHNYFKPKSSYWEGWLVDHPNRKKEIMATISSQVSAVVGNNDLAQAAYYKLKRKLTEKRPSQLAELLQGDFGITAPIEHVDHHFCHATSAYYTAGFPDCTVITLDGGGDGLCSRVYRVRNGVFESLNHLGSYHSIGNYYAYVTRICGFTAHKHEGKITGLAAFGEPKFREQLSKMIAFDGKQIRNRGNAYYWSAVKKLEASLPESYDKKDLASSIQRVLEDVVVAYCEHWVKASGIPRVAVAGGVFANVRLNQKIHELSCVEELFVHPGMGDEGLSFGAALTPNVVPDRHCPPVVDDVYLGPGFSDSEIEATLKSRGVSYRREDQLEQRIAELLAQGHVVARFDGRMEYGPRALGNRSVLYQPNDPSANDWLNQHLKRTEFMPFAPVVREEIADRCFLGMDGARETARFMTITFDCTEEMRRLCPGVVHVDGTARPQVIRKKDNPGYYRILEEYEAITGLPTIVNTSFNVHDEPIVCSPDDALNGFLDGDLDYLAIGTFLAEGRNAKTRERLVTSASNVS
ncbi:MAG: carbamoyltransferase [Candidatus Eisenbacteria bacterium]|nr:carbamoyltransferase [Candidatus Eisenbacteria bacterium]